MKSQYDCKLLYNFYKKPLIVITPAGPRGTYLEGRRVRATLQNPDKELVQSFEYSQSQRLSLLNS